MRIAIWIFLLAFCNLCIAQTTPLIINADGTYLGKWYSPVYSSTDFTGSGSIQWTDTSDARNLLRYTIIGKTISIKFNIWATSIAGIGNSLRIKTPAGKTAAMDFDKPAWIREPGFAGWGGVGLNKNADYITIWKTDGSNFAQSNKQTMVDGEIEFEFN